MQIKEILTKLSWQPVSFIDPIGNKKIYERYKNELE